jgi:signal transduction histidine kinase/streptogramin lyase
MYLSPGFLPLPGGSTKAMNPILCIWQRCWILFFAAIFCASSFAVESNIKITQFSHVAWGADQDAPPRILAIAQTTDDYLWLGTAEGLFRFDGLTFERYQAQPEPPLPSAPVISLLALPDGDLWIGFYSGEISLLQNGHAVNYGRRDGVPKDAVLCLARDQEGTIWAGSAYGLVRLENNRWKTMESRWNFPGTAARAIFVGRDGTLWVATESTIVFLPKGASKFQATGIHVGQVSQIVEAPNGKLWMAESTRSVRPLPLNSRFNPPDTTEISVGSHEILFSRDGDLWISTLGDGLRRAPDPEKLKGKIGRLSSSVETYATKDGLSSDYDLSILQDRNGHIWLGTDRGLDRFSTYTPTDRTGLSKSPQAKTPSIQSVVADGQSFVQLTGLRLPSGIKNLQINYTIATLADPYRAHFRYKLDGFDARWQDADRRRTAYYTNLNPGKYSFHVIAGDMDGAWSARAATINFTIPPFWFQTGWFRTLCVLVLLLAILMIYQLRVAQLKRQFNMAFEARVDERTRIARELHDTLIQSVDGLMLYLQAAVDELDTERSHQMLKEALDRADKTILEGRERVHTLRTVPVATNDLSQALSRYGNERAHDYESEFSVTVVGNPPPLDPHVREEAFRIGREALANAFQHSKASKIEVELTYDRCEIRLRVRDNGTGIDPQTVEAGKQGHWGLSGMRERAHQVGSELKIWSGQNVGTEIDLRIPARLAYRRRFTVFPLAWPSGKASGERSLL